MASAAATDRLDRNHAKVILASSLGTVFEWYDFYLYGLLASIISVQFFSGVDETTGFIFALAAFAAGFAVRPFGALVNVGLPPSDLVVAPASLIIGDKVIAGSNIGGIPLTQEMLDFCAEHGITATIERIDASDTSAVDDAYDRVVAGDVRFRAVIDTSTISPA